eukprot:934556-Prymnesium_polylepis.1
MAESRPTITPVFVRSARYPCFRQPALLQFAAVLLAFAENRNVSSCAPSSALGDGAPSEEGSLQLRRSLDGGASWLPQQSLYAGNIDFYTVVGHAGTSTLWLMLSVKSAATRVAVLASRDHGSTWQESKPLDVDGLDRGSR